MTQDEIIKMAQEAGFRQVGNGISSLNGDYTIYGVSNAVLERFAALFAEATKERCAKVCDDLYKHDRKSSGYDEGWNDALGTAEQAIRRLLK